MADGNRSYYYIYQYIASVMTSRLIAGFIIIHKVSKPSKLNKCSTSPNKAVLPSPNFQYIKAILQMRPLLYHHSHKLIRLANSQVGPGVVVDNIFRLLDGPGEVSSSESKLTKVRSIPSKGHS